MRIAYDPAADAMHVQLVAGSPSGGRGETWVDDNGVIVDTDIDGNPQGYEFLSVRTRGVPIDTLPEQVANAVTEFITGGSLDSTRHIEREYP